MWARDTGLMTNGAGVHNEVSSDVVGSVVQAGAIHQIVLHSRPRREMLPVPCQLPPAIRDFVGRDDQLAALDSLLPSTHQDGTPSVAVISALDGTAGVGKTALAVHWAHRVQDRFPDGTLFANLRGHGPSAPLDPTLVLAWFLNALGVPEDRIPAGLDAQAGLYRSLLARRRVLILLDNAATPDQVRPLLPAIPGCLALITSRATLTGLLVTEAAHRITLDIFTLTEAATLVRRIIGDQRAAMEPHAIANLIAACAGLPLAVRVAATRIGTRPHAHVADIVTDITEGQDRLDALSNIGDDHSAVRTVFDWSYTRLTAEHARTFRRVGLHPGTELGSHAAAALTGLDAITVCRHLETLADLHLIESIGRRRYRMHDLLHAYAAERAERDDAPDDRHRALIAVLTWYAQTVTAADRMMFPMHPSLVIDLGPPVGPARVGDREQALRWLTTEQATILTALRCAAQHGLYRITIALAAGMRFLVLRPRTLWHARLEANSYGLAAARACRDRAAEGSFLERRADTYQTLGQWAESDADLERAMDLAREVDNPVLRGDALCGLGHNRKLQRRYAEALAYYEQALPIVHATRNGYMEAVVECNLSQINARLGRYQRALVHAERELALRQVADDAVGRAYALYDVAVARQGLGDHNVAVELTERAIGIYRSEVASEQYLATALETLAVSLEHTGRRTQAARCLQEGANLLTESGDPHAATLWGRLRDLESTPQPPCDV
jgi:tetratricopeptide (TPR) repeat protein